LAQLKEEVDASKLAIALIGTYKDQEIFRQVQAATAQEFQKLSKISIF
jgi:hypothetical protein